MLLGVQVAEAAGDATAALNNWVPEPAGSALLTSAAGTAVVGVEPNSRRLPAVTVHANGVAVGSPPPSRPVRSPPASHANTPEPRPWTDPDAAARAPTLIDDAAAARGAIDITGATGGAAGDAADEPDPQLAATASTGSETTAPAMSSDVADDGTPGCGPTRVVSTPADTTTPARR